MPDYGIFTINGSKTDFLVKMTNFDQKYNFFTRTAHFFHFQTFFLDSPQNLGTGNEIISGSSCLTSVIVRELAYFQVDLSRSAPSLTAYKPVIVSVIDR